MSWPVCLKSYNGRKTRRTKGVLCSLRWFVHRPQWTSLCLMFFFVYIGARLWAFAGGWRWSYHAPWASCAGIASSILCFRLIYCTTESKLLLRTWHPCLIFLTYAISQGKPVILDIYAEWWGGCHPAADEFESLVINRKCKHNIKAAFTNSKISSYSYELFLVMCKWKGKKDTQHFS